MILSNKLEVEFNKEAINHDFDVFMISKEKGHFFNSNVLDIASQKFSAMSVVYYFGNQWFVLFMKGEVDIEGLKSVISIEDPEAIIHKVNIKEENAIYPNVLAQLLLNTLAGSKNDKFRYNNISGRLYYIRPKFLKEYPKTFYVMYMRLTKDLYISMEVTTFSKVCECSYGKIPNKKFIFDNKSNYFRKKLKSDENPDADCYVEKNISKKKNKVDFLNFHSYEEFCNSKVGIYNEFFQDVQNELSLYMKVWSGGVDEYKNYEFTEEGFENKEYGKILSRKEICLIDEVRTEESNNMMRRVQKELKKYYGLTANFGMIKENAYNIRLIHSKEYCEKNKKDDIHQHSNGNMIFQHITLEDFKLETHKESPALKKVVQELIIKGDIVDSKFSIVNWEMDKDWNFVKADKNWDKENKKHYVIYTKMTIYPNGSFEIIEYDNRDFTEIEEWNLINEKFKKYNMWPTEVEGFVYSKYQDLNIILKTEQTTMPNFSKIGKALKDSNKENYVSVDVICLELEEYLKLSTNQLRIAGAKEMLDKMKEKNASKIKISEVLQLLRIKTSFGKDFNRYLAQNTGISLHPALKSKRVINEYFEAVLDIKYFEKNDKYYYFVGTAEKMLRQSIHNACLLREVISIGEKINMQDLLKLMAVEFVRNGQYTVLPFPFKYLSEIKKSGYVARLDF
jgi:hypothetical protein